MNFFTWDELRCKDGTPYPAEWRDTRGRELLETANLIRHHWGRPIKVVSGYRTPAHNAGRGAKLSQHVQGRAMDIRPLVGGTADDLHDFILELHGRGVLPLLGGLGRYPLGPKRKVGWVHIDTRPAGRAPNRLRRWIG